MLRKRSGTVVAVCMVVLTTLLVLPAPGSAVPPSARDQVLAWNQHAYDELLVIGAQPPPTAILNMAAVHGAMYDAVNAIDRGHEPYLGAPAFAKPGYSKNAAAAAAAYRVLLNLLPAREPQLTGYYQASLATIPDGPRQEGGIDVGEAAAAAMIAFRTNDGRTGSPLFTVGALAGEWRPLAIGANNFQWLGEVRPFLIPGPEMFRTQGPLDMESAEYAAEFDQVKALGRATGSTRTQNQTDAAVFWNENAVATWTRIARQLSTGQGLTAVENARYFAMLYTTGSDALIACFDDKERWHFWRPTTAIQLAGDDGNPDTVADPAWTALLPVPPYPDHPSGHNCFSGSIVRTLQQFYGTNRMSFSATNTVAGPEITRSFSTFSQAIAEIRLARIWGGLHWWTPDAQGAQLGRAVANFRQTHYFGPA
jgi:PAP2 superfamily